MFDALRGLLSSKSPASFAAREAVSLDDLKTNLRAAVSQSPQNVATLIDGYKTFGRSGVSSELAYYAFRDLYFESKGKSNKLINDHVANLFKAEQLQDAPSLLGPVTGANIASITSHIREHGYYRFPQPLSSNLVTDIKRRLDDELRRGNSGAIANEGLSRTTFAEDLLLQVPGVAELAADPLLRQVAAQYLNTSPVLGFVTSWISRAHGNDKETMSKAAQMFHVDMSNPNFLKAFVYLDEVTEANGPHCLVPGSHHRRDDALWRDGRIDDSEMAQHYPEKDWAVLEGPPGSMFIVDTSAFHKGCAVLAGERHILQFYYVDTLFGETVPPSDLSRTLDLGGFGAVPPRFLSRLSPGAAR